MTAAELVDPLVARPERVAHVRIAEDALLAVPVRDPDAVRDRRAEGLQVADRRGGAAVHAGDVAARVELVHPARDERLHRRRARRVVDGVALHVEVDRRAGIEAERRSTGDRVVGGGRPLRRGGCGADVRERGLRDARRLQADVQRHQVPAAAARAGNPVGRELRVRATAVDAADVDPDRAVRRGEPGAERGQVRRRAGIEAVAGEHRRPRAYGGRPRAGDGEREHHRQGDAAESLPPSPS